MPDPQLTLSAESEATRLLQRMVAEAGDLFMVFDRELYLRAANAAFQRDFLLHFGRVPQLGDHLPTLLAAHPDDLATLQALFARALQGESFTAIVPVGAGTKRLRYEAVFGSLAGEAGMIEHAYGIARNVEAREREHANRQEEIALERERLRSVLDVLPVGVWIADRDGRFIARNQAGIRIWGEDAPMSERPEDYARDYRGWWPDGREIAAHEWGVARALGKGEVSLAEEIEILGHDGKRRTVINYALPIRNSAGEIAGAVAVNVDITERKREERARDFLSEVSTVLASSLDYNTTLQRIASLAVPFLADYCIVDVIERDGQPRRVAAVHAQAQQQELLDRMLDFPPVLNSGSVTARVLQGEGAQIMRDVHRMDPLELSGNRPVLAQLIAELEPHCYICAPMSVGGRIVGAILLVRSFSKREYDAIDLGVAVELARRSALAVDNAQRHAAEAAARAVAEEASRVKSQFLATMSHELRTPLTGIIGYAELLDEQVTGPLNPQQQLQLSRIRSSAWHLVTIIDEILLFARAEAGREQVRPAIVDLDALVQDSVAIVEPQARAKGLSLEVQPIGSDGMLHTDQGKLRQILLNLLGNAVKFTEQGGIRVSVRLDTERAEVYVRDTGPGIARDQLERIFEPFTQVDSSNTRDKGGTGLGLTVSRRLAQMLGGDLRVESRPGEGSTFSLHIPRNAQVRSPVPPPG